MPPKKADDVLLLIEKKFMELKEDLVKEIRQQFLEEFAEFKNEVKGFIKQQDNNIAKLESTVALLQTHVTGLKEENDQLRMHCEENEQYSRRLCLRIEDIPIEEEETSKDVFNKVNALIEKCNVKIPECVLDRAHRIGRIMEDDDGKKKQSIIVRFSTFRHRTEFYKARKALEGVARVRLDLTRRRYSLLNNARSKVENNEKVKFVYADINCQLKIHPSHGKDVIFNSEEGLDACLEKL